MSNKLQYPTFARTKPTDSQISQSVVSILETFQWKKITFIHSDEKEFQHAANTIYQVCTIYTHIMLDKARLTTFFFVVVFVLFWCCGVTTAYKARYIFTTVGIFTYPFSYS